MLIYTCKWIFQSGFPYDFYVFIQFLRNTRETFPIAFAKKNLIQLYCGLLMNFENKICYLIFIKSLYILTKK